MASFLSTDENWMVGASFCWDNFNHIRVYGSKPDGQLVEWQYDGNGWTGPSDLPGRATPHTPISVVACENDSGVHIRVYFHSDGRIKELAYENGWGNGSVLP